MLNIECPIAHQSSITFFLIHPVYYTTIKNFTRTNIDHSRLTKCPLPPLNKTGESQGRPQNKRVITHYAPPPNHLDSSIYDQDVLPRFRTPLTSPGPRYFPPVPPPPFAGLIKHLRAPWVFPSSIL